MKTVFEIIIAVWLGGFVLIVALSIRKHRRRKAREKAADISHLQQYGSRQ